MLFPPLPGPPPQVACAHQAVVSRPDLVNHLSGECPQESTRAQDADDSFFGTFTSCTAEAIPGFSFATNASCKQGALTTTVTGTRMQAGHALPVPVSDHATVTFRLNFVPGTNNAFIGFTSAAAGVPSASRAQQFGVRVEAMGVSLCNAGNCTVLLPGTALPAGAYDFTLMLPGDGMAIVSVVAANPADTEGKAFRLPYRVPVPLNNIEVETGVIADQITAFASSVDRSGEVVAYPIPHRNGYANSALMIPLPITAETSRTTAYAWIPPGYRNDGENRWVLVGHGYLQSGQMITLQYNSAPHRLGVALMRNGYVTVTVDNTVASCWGNGQCVADLKNVRDAVEKAISLQDQPYLLGDSMGGLQILNAVSSGVIQPKALVGICINTNLSWIYYKQNLGGAPLIGEAYGFTTDEGYASATASFDPQIAASVAGAAQSRLIAVPMLLFASDQDAVVLKASNADLFARTLKAAGGDVTVIGTTGPHEDPSNFDGDRIVNFLNQH